jgi:hypothetical protein
MARKWVGDGGDIQKVEGLFCISLGVQGECWKETQIVLWTSKQNSSLLLLEVLYEWVSNGFLMCCYEKWERRIMRIVFKRDASSARDARGAYNLIWYEKKQSLKYIHWLNIRSIWDIFIVISRNTFQWTLLNWSLGCYPSIAGY